MKPGQLEALDHERDERERKARKGGAVSVGGGFSTAPKRTSPGLLAGSPGPDRAVGGYAQVRGAITLAAGVDRHISSAEVQPLPWDKRHSGLYSAMRPGQQGDLQI